MVSLIGTDLKVGFFNIQELTTFSLSVFLKKLGKLQSNQMNLIDICVTNWFDLD